jgi:hypothetical protein
VQAIETSVNGAVTATVQSISASVNGSLVTLIPLKSSGTAASSTTDMGAGLFGWTCGGTGTSVLPKYLPGSCRGT